jgi:hypothetical protein
MLFSCVVGFNFQGADTMVFLFQTEGNPYLDICKLQKYLDKIVFIKWGGRRYSSVLFIGGRNNLTTTILTNLIIKI